MENSEKAPLYKRRDYRNVFSPERGEVVAGEGEGEGEAGVVVQCCGVESTRLGRVPVIRTLFKKKTAEKVACSSTLV